MQANWMNLLRQTYTVELTYQSSIVYLSFLDSLRTDQKLVVNKLIIIILT